MAFSSCRFLPPWDDLPEDFRSQAGNTYTLLVENIFYDRPLPDQDMDIKDGYTPEAINRVIRSHLASWMPKHEHKIAGVGYLLSQMAVLEPA